MTAPLETSLVRISHQEVVFGAGFLVNSGHILTCSHVIESIRKAAHNSGLDRVSIDFAILEPRRFIQTDVVYTRPSQNGDDIAVLKPDTTPAGARAEVLVDASDLWRHTFRVTGFPAGYSGGAHVGGEMQGRDDRGYVTLVAGVGHRIRRGFSGGPVWDESLGGIVGMVMEEDLDESNRGGRMLPVSRIASLLSTLSPEVSLGEVVTVRRTRRRMVLAGAGLLAAGGIGVGLWRRTSRKEVQAAGQIAAVYTRIATLLRNYLDSSINLVNFFGSDTAELLTDERSTREQAKQTYIRYVEPYAANRQLILDERPALLDHVDRALGAGKLAGDVHRLLGTTLETAIDAVYAFKDIRDAVKNLEGGGSVPEGTRIDLVNSAKKKVPAAQDALNQLRNDLNQWKLSLCQERGEKDAPFCR